MLNSLGSKWAHLTIQKWFASQTPEPDCHWVKASMEELHDFSLADTPTKKTSLWNLVGKK